MNNTLMLSIWGRELPIEIEYDCFSNETVTSLQDQTLQNFLSEQEKILRDCYTKLEEYCMEKFPQVFRSPFDNIFKYIKPKIIYIKRASTDRICGLLCNFKIDPEHGLAVYIVNEAVIKVGPQEIIL